MRWSLAWLILLGMFLILRGFNLATAFLPQVDEISLLNQVSLPFLSGGAFSTTYFPLSLLTIILAPTFSLGSLRLVPVAAHLVAVALLVLASKRNYSEHSRLIFALLAVTHWYFNYIGRLYNVDPFTFIFAAIHFFFLERWYRSANSNSTVLLAFALVAAALGLDNYAAPWLYYLPFLFAFLAWDALRHRKQFLPLLISSQLFIVAALPFIYVLLHANAPRDLNYLTELSGKHLTLFPSLVNPGPFFRSFVETFTFHANSTPSIAQSCFALFLAAAPFLSLSNTNRGNALQRFAIFGYGTQILLIFLSPIVPKHTGNFAMILIFYFWLIAGLSGKARLAQVVVIASTVLFGVESFVSNFWTLNQSQLAQNELNAINNSGDSHRILFSDGAYLKFLALGAAGPRETIAITNCDHSLSSTDLEPYRYLFLTTECDPLLPPGEFNKVWAFNQLLEAHSVHGIGFYTRR